ncbi:Uncharacterised protein [Mycobacteroides abscessus subsp. abscessus]|nr:Uncharacterised protein [Mycobacteroides abscessus subsp. abscessus]
MTFCARSSSCESAWSRLLIVRESSVTPSSAARSGAGVSAKVAESASSVWSTLSMSSPSTVVASSPSASLSEYGEVVRSSGMVSARRSAPAPAGTTSSDLRPSTVLVLIAADVLSPNTIDSSRVKRTSTLSPASSTSSTRPERTPATCTLSPGTSPPASAK